MYFPFDSNPPECVAIQFESALDNIALFWHRVLAIVSSSKCLLLLCHNGCACVQNARRIKKQTHTKKAQNMAMQAFISK